MGTDRTDAYQSIAGANVLLNLSASNETVGKAVYRKGLVATQSGKCNAAYCYASAGPSESTTDLVFSGHCLIAENGSLLAESKRIGTGLPIGPIAGLGPIAAFATADIDLDRIEQDRRATGTMHQRLSPERTFRRIPFALERGSRPLQRWIDPHPFVPKENAALQERCDEIFEIQIAALAKRVQQLPSDLPLVIGVSGGLDSTLATLVAAKMLDAMGWSGERILGITMPGFGTSDQTRRNAGFDSVIGAAERVDGYPSELLSDFSESEPCSFGRFVRRQNMGVATARTGAFAQ